MKQNYWSMCIIIKQIVPPITPKFVVVVTKFGKSGKRFKCFTVVNISALYKKMFRQGNNLVG